jgi:hypothetical protein
VSAQLVGRSWYVSESSLELVSEKRISAIRNDEILLKNNVSSSRFSNSKVIVEAPFSKNTKKMLTSSYSEKPSRNSFTIAHYESDQEDLLPTPHARKIVPTIPESVRTKAKDDKHILLEEPLDQPVFVKIVTESKKRNKLHFIPPPAVRLTGSIPLTRVENPLFIDTETHLSFPMPERKLSQTPVPHTAQNNTQVEFTPRVLKVRDNEAASPPRVSSFVATGLIFLGLCSVLASLTIQLESRSEGATVTTKFSVIQFN